MSLLDWLRRVFGSKPVSQPTSPPLYRVLPAIPVATIVGQTQGGRQPPPLPTRAGQPPVQLPPASSLSSLDASRFAPMSAGQIRGAINTLDPNWRDFVRGGWGRDKISDPNLPRIQLIDRGMVAVGLISPEELVEIHQVGQQMEQARGSIDLAQGMAEQAVTRSKEEREAIKQRKKAEAAQRREQHAREVAERRRTDIVFLGRGVSRGLADRRSNVERLQAVGLPVLATPADVARALGVQIGRLRWLAFHSEASPVTHYVRFTVPKKSGGVRQLFAPHRSIAACQQWILTNILSCVPATESAHGFVPGRSTVTNARQHVGRGLLINMDLKDFFPSVTFPRVKGIFQSMGYSPAAATILALLSTECPRKAVEYAGKTYHVATGPRGLPQGACTSPALSNLATRRLDRRLAGLGAKLGWNYTRYADDLSFSADRPAALAAPAENVPPVSQVGYLHARVRHILADEGFVINEKKTRVLGRNAAQTVTGIVVNDKAAVPRRLVRRIRAILHRARTGGLDAQNRDQQPHFRSWLGGMIAYIAMVSPQHGRPLREAWDKLAQ